MADRIGVDIGGSFVKAGIVSAGGLVLRQAEPVPTVDGPGVVAGVLALVEGLLASRPGIGGIGISSCGIVDSRRGVVVDSVSVPGYTGTDWKTRLGGFGLPIVVENDARAAAWAEYRLREDRAVKDWIHLPLGTSIGSGIIVGGRLWRGRGHSAGEIGHVTVEAGGPVCSCGNVGCLELYVSNESLLNYVAAELANGRASSLNGAGVLDLQRLSEAEHGGDALAREAFERMGHYLGIGLTTMVNLFNPAVVTIGGGTAQASETILRAARAHVETHALGPAQRGLRIIPGRLGNHAGFVGAALLTGGKSSFAL
ncbi:MAG TPA: ROK family protein [Anaerolineales bacterium]|nr:ROK family protein [Anaerolineales bacterium]